MAHIPISPKARRHEGRDISVPNSFNDLLYVAPDELLTDKETQWRNDKHSAQGLMGMEKTGGSKARQDHENEPAEVVIVCEPEGTSLMMGGLHPRYIASSSVLNLVLLLQHHL